MTIVNILEQRLNKINALKHQQQQQQQPPPPNDAGSLPMPPSPSPSPSPSLPLPLVCPFTGDQSTMLTCLTCRYSPPARAQSFNTLSLCLPFESNSISIQSIGSVDIESLMDAYVKPELLHDVNCEMCSIIQMRDECLVKLLQARKALDAHIAQSTDSTQSVATSSTSASTSASASAFATASAVASDESDASDRQKHKLIVRLQNATRQLCAMEKHLMSRSNSISTILDPSKNAVATMLPLETLLSAPDPPPLQIKSYVKRTFMKRLTITRMPPLLCLHMNRLIGDTKLNTHVSFAATLDRAIIDKLQNRVWPSQDQASQSSDADQREVVTDADSSQIESAKEPASTATALKHSSTPSSYALRAVVMHHGRSRGGHFTTYRRHSVRQRIAWSWCNDFQVTPASFAAVQKAQAYMLFYSVS